MAVKLKFTFTGGNLKTGNWFHKQFLTLAFPWNVEDMKNAVFNIFSLTGHVDQRRFMINRSFAGCSGDRGYLMLSHHNVCTWEKNTPYNVEYIYTPNPDAHVWKTGVETAIEFRISGEYGLDTNDRVYKAGC